MRACGWQDIYYGVGANTGLWTGLDPGLDWILDCNIKLQATKCLASSPGFIEGPRDEATKCSVQSFRLADAPVFSSSRLELQVSS